MPHCAEHDWWFEEDDTCPIDEGIKLERSRIVELIKEAYSDKNFANRGSLEWTVDVIKLIEGELDESL